LFLLLLLSTLLRADDSFTESNSKVTFVGKSMTAKARLEFKGKALNVNFVSAYKDSSLTIKTTLDFGGCVVEASLFSIWDKPYLSFKEQAINLKLFGFPTIAELSSDEFKAHDPRKNGNTHLQPCKPTFKTEGDFKVINFSVTFEPQVGLLIVNYRF